MVDIAILSGYADLTCCCLVGEVGRRRVDVFVGTRRGIGLVTRLEV
jgi:hypothetical protein